MSRLFSAFLCLLLITVLMPAAHAAPADLMLPAEVSLRAMISLAESQLTSTAQALRVIAASDAAGAGDWDKLAPLLAEVQPPTSGLVWFARPDGTYRAIGADTTGLSLKDRPYFAKLRAGETAIGDLVTGKFTGRSSVVVAVPVMRDKQMIGAVGASIYLDELSRRLTNTLSLPGDWGFWGLDESGRITTLHILTERIFLDPSQVGSPSLTLAVHAMLRKPNGVATYTWTDGKRRSIVYRHSELLKWIFVIDGPKK
ncbi:MAG: hypothetical protein ABFE08_02155 [Armatimonadia bacterium]